MDLFVWKDAFNINIEELDRQHKLFFEYINLMFEAVGRYDKEDLLMQTFANLAMYAERHFRDEESMMGKTGYPGLESQKSEHISFLSRLEELKNGHLSDNPAIPESTLAFMRDWLLEHILQQDKKFGVYLAESAQP